mgnify:CR=1 FL=1
MVGLVITLILTLCVQVYTFRQSIKNKKQIKNFERNQKGLDDALHVEREDDGKVKGWEINAGFLKNGSTFVKQKLNNRRTIYTII